LPISQANAHLQRYQMQTIDEQGSVATVERALLIAVARAKAKSWLWIAG